MSGVLQNFFITLAVFIYAVVVLIFGLTGTAVATKAVFEWDKCSASRTGNTRHNSTSFLPDSITVKRKGQATQVQRKSHSVREVKFMEIIIKGVPKEIAALVLAVQGQQISVDEIMKQITDQIASELSSVHIL